MGYYDLSTSINRGDYWVKILFTYFVLGLGFLANILLQGTPAGELIGQGAILVTAFYTMIVIAIASIQRLNNIGISAWWALLLAVPTVGIGALVVFGCLPSLEPVPEKV